MEQREYERITKLEVKLESMNETMMRIEKNLERNNSNYVIRTEMDEMFKSRDREIKELKQAQEKNDNNKKANISMWISGLSLAVLVLFNTLNYMK